MKQECTVVTPVKGCVLQVLGKILFPDEQGGIFPTFPALLSGKTIEGEEERTTFISAPRRRQEHGKLQQGFPHVLYHFTNAMKCKTSSQDSTNTLVLLTG